VANFQIGDRPIARGMLLARIHLGQEGFTNYKPKGVGHVYQGMVTSSCIDDVHACAYERIGGSAVAVRGQHPIYGNG